jgi:hypothetical protein
VNKWNLAQGPEDLTDTELGCRINRHPWPRLRPGKPIPKAVDVHRQPDGWFEVTYPCPECDAILVEETYKGDVRYRRTIYPDGWNRIPRSAGIRKSEIRGEFYARLDDDLVRAAS